MLGAARGHAEAAVADHHRGDAMPDAARGVRLPGELGVVVRVNVDEAGSHGQPLGVDLLPAPARHPAHLHDRAIVHGHIARESGSPAPVHHSTPADHQIVHVRLQNRFCGIALLPRRVSAQAVGGCGMRVRNYIRSVEGSPMLFLSGAYRSPVARILVFAGDPVTFVTLRIGESMS